MKKRTAENSKVPTYLVKAPDGNLYGYWNEDILRCDLAENRKQGIVELFKLNDGWIKTHYKPITAEDIKD